MAFRLPANLKIGYQFQVADPAEFGEIGAMEKVLGPYTRILVGLAVDEVYDGFAEDCELANTALGDMGMAPWPEYGRLVTADPDGEPVVWVSYLSGTDGGDVAASGAVAPAIVWWIPALIGLVGGVLGTTWFGSTVGQPVNEGIGGITNILVLVVLMMLMKNMFTGNK